MVEIEIDGKKVEVTEGSMVMHAAEKLGTYIPHFCYHKKLSIAANCRMCLVDVEKAPKPMPACATPVTQGMVVKTKTERAIKAQKSVMEFLLINHPLDCPICDQGGECQLQDLAVGYGGSSSRYEEEKRVVFHKDVGPLISMEEMSRCIHCTRCVRFGQEIAGVMELGMSHRGEHSEIEAFVGDTVDSELSGNMIDVCPVGALTSKPFRYQARTWELGRRKSISPHDATGANIIIQVKNNQVMRVVPLENEDINECWIADRDRFSYEALNSADRLTAPMIKQGGEWTTVDWQTALDYVANGLQQIKTNHGANTIGILASPHSTAEELYLAGALMRGLGSDNIDSRLRAADFTATKGVRWLGTSISSLSHLQHVLIIGSNIRKDQPLLAQRIRQAARRGAKVHALNATSYDWAMSVSQVMLADATVWMQSLANIATAVAALSGATAPVQGVASDQAKAIAASLMSGERKAILLGNAAAHHPQASSLLNLANWIAKQCNASVGYLGESANTVGAQMVGAQPQANGLNAMQMITTSQLKAVFLLNTEPKLDTAYGEGQLSKADMVVTLSPFKTNLDISDVVLPISPFTETAGTFVNTEGRTQSFHGVVKPLAETRPAWKVLRVLGTMMHVPDFEFDTIEQVRAKALPSIVTELMSNESITPITTTPATSQPVSASIYQLDALVRRAPALQHTADAREVH
ncbi:MAG: NADH-quinone oxidoreductase subunit NuoG [Burkholderiaceae bacterium]